MNGILVIDKEKDYTSRDIVNIVSKYLKTKKVGHTGTLDPLATGVLVVCIGEATKVVELITGEDKEYIASVTLGIETDTLDITGKVTSRKKVEITEDEILKTLKKFNTEYMQEVPLYSAIRIQGKKLYQYAFDNEEIKELPKRKVNIKELELISDITYNNDLIEFKIRCVVSKGTYIRSLIRDIAYDLNTIGVMSDLRRIRQGNFKIEDSITLKDLENNNFSLINIIEALNNYKKVEVDDKLLFKVKNGQILDNIYGENEILFTYKNKPIFLYKLYDKDNTKIKPWKSFGGNYEK